VFVDKNLRVLKCVQNIKPNRLLMPVWGARSVFELNPQTIHTLNIEIGDQLHVVS
jgi:uncharacterized membrane protein (UPF0127 family)